MVLTAHDKLGNTNGASVVPNEAVTVFTNTEEAAVGLTDVIPFLVEDMLKQKDANYSRPDDWWSHVAANGLLITGQNLVSSEPVPRALLEKLF